MVNLQNIKVKANSSFQTVCPFPVGFVYSSMNSTSPASTFGGSWTEIKGRFPYFNAGTNTGGSSTHSHSLSSGYAKVRWDFSNSPNLQIAKRSDVWSASNGCLIEWYPNYMSRYKETSLCADASCSAELGGSTVSGGGASSLSDALRLVQNSVAPLLEAM